MEIAAQDVIDAHLDVMEWDDGMIDHPGDYFADTRYQARELRESAGLSASVNDIQEYIEKKVIEKLKSREKVNNDYK